MQNHQGITRFAVAAGRSVGKAVQRNRAKRLMREALRSLIPTIVSGWDVILIARRPVSASTIFLIREALINLLNQAGLLKNNDI